jgi:hypothetical protein
MYCTTPAHTLLPPCWLHSPLPGTWQHNAHCVTMPLACMVPAAFLPSVPCPHMYVYSGVRDDIAFKLTYYLGRVAQLAPGQVIGHPQAAIAHCSSRIPSEAEQLLSSYLPGARYTTEVAPATSAAAAGVAGGDVGADGAPSSHMQTRAKRSSTVGLMTTPPAAAAAGAAGAAGGADAAASRTQDVVGATVSSSVGQATGAACAAKKVTRTTKAKFVRVPGESGHGQGDCVPGRTSMWQGA